ncbi:MAG TPA: chorismate mutase [Candidatus Caccovicinus merdipullorum]|uniref:Bifunctional chorismate mutase/prephenate dehydratase n=1 Tax=Candidatus Caccovicinus merdipullorum TaxID=2840724 RepID=A0A9D1GIU0_9FIRM|nr:chorismate mutase [Candidatus Caccovicinus merdipullorum]
MKNLDLQEIRKQIDQVDSQLAALIEQRMRLTADVAEYKMQNGKEIYDPVREKEKLASVRAMAKTPFGEIAMGEIFAQMMTISRRYQYQVLGSYGNKADGGFKLVENLPTAGARIVYQGVEGAYSHEAALQVFGRDADVYNVPAWDDAMKEVAEGRAAYAVLPIENSSAGAVIDNYDLLLKYDNYIVAETEVSVNHALLGLPDAELSDIKTVISHPQALMQCSEFLKEHRDWKQIQAENTAGAAKRILADGDVTQAAIASPKAGEIYGLKILKPSINHNRTNTTRFIVLGKEPVYRLDARKVSVCFETPHVSGALYNMLGHFIYNHVNMLMIQSRPILERNWEYRFFLDIEGSLSDGPVQNALLGLKSEAVFMRILGNY